MLKKLSVACAFTAALAAAPILAQQPSGTMPSTTVTAKKVVLDDPENNVKQDIVDTVEKAGPFKTFGAALETGGLVETLKGKGPFTVFAPTDEAFAKLPKGTVESLLRPENKDKLIAILKYHVISGTVMAADIAKLKTAKTSNGASLTIRTQGDSVMLDNGKVTKANIACTNGVIHAIDTVLTPKE
jgi:transforming growth factor-beta-induced protein